MNCCTDIRESEYHCGACHQTFTGIGLFDKHQDVDYARPHADIVRCAPAPTLGLVCNARGTWGTPEGMKARERSAERLAAARSERALADA